MVYKGLDSDARISKLSPEEKQVYIQFKENREGSKNQKHKNQEDRNFLETIYNSTIKNILMVGPSISDQNCDCHL